MFIPISSERRKLNRVYVQLAIDCEIIDKEHNTVINKTAVSWDINSDGIFLKMNVPVALNTEMNIAFTVPKTNHIIHAAIQVIRVETTDDQFYIGAVFTKLDEKDKHEILQLTERLNIGHLLELLIKKNGSDLHLVTDMPPVLRVHGNLEITHGTKLDSDDITNLIYSAMNKQQIKKFEENKDLDFGIQYDNQTRFKVNVHQQKGFIEGVFRLINTQVQSFETLRISETVKELTRLKEGLVIISGPAGSGKTTTIAAMIDLINQERKVIIITLERPIEYIHSNNQSIIKQREIGVDTLSFSSALNNSLKQDPNVLVVGELDNAETVKTALFAAETGYLVITAFHGPDTTQTIDRLVNMFPLENRKQVLTQLANCLKGIVCQLLIPCKDRKQRVLAAEILLTNDAAKKVIRNDELYQLPTIIQTNMAQKMLPMREAIKRYVRLDLVDIDTANFYSQEFSKYSIQ